MRKSFLDEGSAFAESMEQTLKHHLMGLLAPRMA